MTKGRRTKGTISKKNTAASPPLRAPRRSPRRRAPVAIKTPAAARAGAGRRVIPLITLTVCALLVGFDLLFEAPASSRPAFKGYDTVLYRGSRPLSEVTAFMEKQPGIEAVVSRETAEVLFTDFSGFSTVTLAQVSQRFDALDPRYDEYMKQLERYFTFREGGSRWDVLYVAASRNSLSLSLVLPRIAGTGPEDWILDTTGNEGRMAIIALIGTVFFISLFTLVLRPVFHVLATAGILPWLHALAGSKIEVFALFFLVSAAWCFFLREFLSYCDNETRPGSLRAERRPLLVRLGLYGGMMFVAACCAVLGTVRPATVACALFCQAAGAGVYWGWLRAAAFAKKKKRSKSFRVSTVAGLLRRFEPRETSDKPNRRAVHAVVIILCLVYPVLLLLPASRSVSFPIPSPVAPGAPIAMSSIRRLSEAKSADSLPDLSDFVRHAAFQERLAYEKHPAYAIPAPGEYIAVSEYRTDASDGEVVRSEKTVLAFDDEWLRGLEKRAGRSSVATMLFAQGQCLSMAFSREFRGDRFREGDWTIIVIFSIVLVPLLLLQYTAFPGLVYGMRKSNRPTKRKKR
ncbi:MAG: hypothetical protein JXD23_11405 [Spirochaetales bacterium]|nr:hypothetical protein [Spirochaetales bacterium]